MLKHSSLSGRHTGSAVAARFTIVQCESDNKRAKHYTCEICGSDAARGSHSIFLAIDGSTLVVALVISSGGGSPSRGGPMVGRPRPSGTTEGPFGGYRTVNE